MPQHPREPSPVARVIDAIGAAFRNYANFTGRTSRAAYWWWLLFATVVTAAASILGAAFQTSLWPSAFAGLALALPTVAATARRLHDSGRSAWHLLWWYSVIGFPYLLYLLLAPTTPGENRYGSASIQARSSSRRRRAERGLAVVAAGLFVVLWLLGLRAYVNHHDGIEVIPAELAARAELACLEVDRDAPPRSPLAPSPTVDERAQRVEAAVAVQEAMIARLRVLPGTESSSGLQRWLDDYEAFTRIGRDYAMAIRSGDPDKYIPAGNKGDQPQISLSRTAKANGMPACLPQ